MVLTEHYKEQLAQHHPHLPKASRGGRRVSLDGAATAEEDGEEEGEGGDVGWDDVDEHHEEGERLMREIEAKEEELKAARIEGMAVFASCARRRLSFSPTRSEQMSLRQGSPACCA